MTSKWGVRSGILVAILAQCALGACDGEEDPSLDSDGGTGGGEPTGDGDGGTGGAKHGGEGGGYGCNDLILRQTMMVHVRGGWQDEEEECRATVAVTFEGKGHQLSCVGAGSDCTCTLPLEIGLPRNGVTLTVSEGDTILHELSDLQDADCEGSFGSFEVDYIEALGEAVDTLSDATQELASPEPCETEADCDAVPLGAKACGGPWSYIVASTQSETYSDVVALSEELERIERLHGELADLTSDCAYVVAPDVSCEEGVCLAISPD